MPGMKTGSLYKYAITAKPGEVVLKSDPYGYYFEVRPSTASVTYRLDDYEWQKSSKRLVNKIPSYELPISIYEVHADPGNDMKMVPY